MNKTYSEQIAKVASLAEGIRQNAESLSQQHISTSTEKLESTAKLLEEAALKQEAAGEALKVIRQQAHELLDRLKNLYTDAKSPIKLNYPPEQWHRFGIPDKR